MGRVLILGLGYVGRQLADELMTRGHAPVGLARRPQSTNYQTAVADLRQPDTLRRLPYPFDAAVFCAAPDERSERGYRGVYVDGLSHALAALDSENPPGTRVVFISSTAVYGQIDGSWVSERSEVEPRQFTGKLLLEAEALLEGRAGATVLRASGIYGPTRTRLIDAVRNGTADFHTGADDYTNRIHRDDLARAIAHVLDLERPDPLYLASDREPATKGTVLRFIADTLGLVPGDGQRPSNDGKGSGAPQGTTVARPRNNKRCDSARLVETGFEFRYPTFREGYGELIKTTAR